MVTKNENIECHKLGTLRATRVKQPVSSKLCVQISSEFNFKNVVEKKWKNARFFNRRVDTLMTGLGS